MFVVTLFFVISFVPNFTVVALALNDLVNFRNQMTRLQFMSFQIGYRAPMIISYTCMDVNYRNQIKFILTLKAPIITAADDKFCEIFPNFQKKKKKKIGMIFHENRLPADECLICYF